jgi:hypothetical protein
LGEEAGEVRLWGGLVMAEGCTLVRIRPLYGVVNEGAGRVGLLLGLGAPPSPGIFKPRATVWSSATGTPAGGAPVPSAPVRASGS